LAGPIRVLLQTTIPTIEDDWHIGRFSRLRDYLAGETDVDGAPLFAVTARDRTSPGAPDPVLSTLNRADYDELWLFAVDVGDGLDPLDCEAITRFREDGGGLMVARDHMDLGSSVCSLGGVGKAHIFHSKNRDPNPERHCIDDCETPAILWPNFHSGSNGDYQHIQAIDPPHSVLRFPDVSGGLIRFLPAHPHEGAVGAPPEDPTARVIATGCSQTTGATFNIAVAFEPTASAGAAIAQSTFHHFADYNWDTLMGAPSFVTEQPSDRITRHVEAMAATKRYVYNVAMWLAGRSSEISI
jgi:hypothetical protein